MRSFVLVILLISGISMLATAQTSTFTYQGKLSDGPNPANGTYEMQFSLYTAVSGGSQVGTTISNSSVSVLNGVFTVNLNFSPATPFAAGADRFLEIAVRKATDPPGFTTLTPRQQITSSPYSIRTLSASVSDSLSSACVACIDNAKINDVAGSKVSGTVGSAVSVTGVVQIANGGTGSSTQNFVDLSSNQSVAGNKTFTGVVVAQNSAAAATSITGSNTAATGVGTGTGVVGSTNQAGTLAAGVRGQNTHANGNGMIAAGNGQPAVTLLAGSGLAATGFTTGIFAKSTTGGNGEAIYTDQFSEVTRVNYWNGSTQFKINGVGTVSTLVRDEQKRRRIMFAPEAPEVLFEDYGTGQLVNGRARIEIDPVFSKNITVNDQHPLRVFIQLEGDCKGVYVTNKSGSGFDVMELAQGKSNVRFSWHIVGNRADEELAEPRKTADGISTTRISRYADLRFPVQADDRRTNTSEVGEKP